MIDPNSVAFAALIVGLLVAYRASASIRAKRFIERRLANR